MWKRLCPSLVRFVGEKEEVMEKTMAETVKEIKERVEAKGNPYANGRGKAILQRLIQDKKDEQERAKREYQENPELRKMYAELKEQQRIADGKQNHTSTLSIS
jgi:effector-binding domain-containing protein